MKGQIRLGRVVFIRWEKLKQLNANGNVPVKKETKSMAWKRGLTIPLQAGKGETWCLMEDLALDGPWATPL